MSKQIYGETLADFHIANANTSSKLLAAEDKLLEAVFYGQPCIIGDNRPEELAEYNRVRSSFLRFLLLGGDSQVGVHKKGIHVSGAFIDGDFEFEGCQGAVALILRNCLIAGEFNLRDAHTKLIDLSGSRVAGIDAKAATIQGGIHLRNGFLSEGEVRLRGAEIIGSLICSAGEFRNPGGNALTCDGANITDAVFMRRGMITLGEVRLAYTKIGSQLDCRGANFKNPTGIALLCYAAKIDGPILFDGNSIAEGGVVFARSELRSDVICEGSIFSKAEGIAIDCDGTKIHGSVFLNKGCKVNGEVCFSYAEIGRKLDCSNSIFINKNQFTINCEKTKIIGDVFLFDGFKSEGEVRVIHSEIGGNLVCVGGEFSNKVAAARISDDEPVVAGYALNLYNTKIHGVLWLGPGTFPFNKFVDIEGSLHLSAAHTEMLVDDPRSWPIKSIKTDDHGDLPCVIRLFGFTYRRFGGSSPTDAKTRREWLMRQPSDHLSESFRPQPFEQLVQVLRTMGHEEDARQIAMYKQEQLHPLQVRRAPVWRRPFVWLVGVLWGMSCGYGYRPHRLVVALLTLWLGCAAIYFTASEAFVPADAQIWTDEKLARKCSANWTTCDDVRGPLPFNAVIYSADIILPIIDLRQRSTWTPGWDWMRVIVWLENIVGSVGVLLLGAILSGLIKRD